LVWLAPEFFFDNPGLPVVFLCKGEHMLVKDIMTENPKCATPDMNLVSVAKIMKDCDCGAVPVTRSESDRQPIGIITDRDIAIRAVAEDMSPSKTKVRECMSESTITIAPNASVEECASLMKEKQVRRLVVVEGGRIRGIVVQAQIARKASKDVAAETIRKISEPAPDFAHTLA
jgi:CBS domain-containing protein